MTSTLSAIHVFPIKSCAPLVLDSAELGPRGLRHDRRWIVTDAEGRFLTGRQQPRLTLLRAVPDGDALDVSAPGMSTLRLETPKTRDRLPVTVWSSNVAALPADAASDAWISRFLGMPARFACMDAACVRPVDPNYAREGDEVSFADAFPLMLISQAALDALNARLAAPVPMLRFRPNLVIANTAPHAEDGWKRIRIGTVELDIVKPCARCVFTTVDFEKGAFDPSGEPLRTLIGYRRSERGVLFGQNAIPRATGTLRVGDEVEVLA
ncbi:MAG TPA: MOSC N-terminal beta barrel domain-containing protein [Rhodanobacteraceae bacterium]|nr:MOSC N-terminal beta barrel domain-containing protein [Rhodanobacteraceae bacterium]